MANPYWLIVAFILVLGSNLYASPDMTKRDTLALKMSFQLPEKIKLGEPFDLSFTVVVQDSVPHDNDSLDEIDVMLPDGCRVLGGKPVWQGRLYRGCTVVIQLRAQITEPMQGVFEGFVYSGFIPKHMNLYRTVNIFTSNEISVLKTIKRESVAKPLEPITESSRKRCLVPPIDGPSGATGNDLRTVIPVEIVGGAITGDDNYWLTRNTLNSLSFWFKESPAATAVRTVPQRWQLSCPLYDMALNSDSTTTILIDEQIDTTTISFEIQGKRYQVRLQVADVVSPPGR
jgi:hypothetical protein